MPVLSGSGGDKLPPEKPSPPSLRVKSGRAHTSSPNPAAPAEEQIGRVSCLVGAGRSGQLRRLGHEEAPEEGRVRVALERSAVSSDLDVLLVDVLVGPEAGRMADF